MKDPKEIRQLLYNALRGHFNDLGTLEEFNQKLEIPEKRNLLYNAIKDDFIDIGTYDEFNQKLCSIKPTPNQISSSTIFLKAVQKRSLPKSKGK